MVNSWVLHRPPMYLLVDLTKILRTCLELSQKIFCIALVEKFFESTFSLIQKYQDILYSVQHFCDNKRRWQRLISRPFLRYRVFHQNVRHLYLTPKHEMHIKHCSVRWEINCTLAIINLEPSSKVSAESSFAERIKMKYIWKKCNFRLQDFGPEYKTMVFGYSTK